MTFEQAVWVLPALYAVHALEEWRGGFAEWARRYVSARYTDDDFLRINTAGFLVTLGATALVARFPNRPLIFLYYSGVLTQQALFNPVFHAGATVAFRTCSPGLLTSLALFWPAWGGLTRVALLTRRGVLVAAAMADPLHIAAVAQQVFKLGVREWHSPPSPPHAAD